MRCAGRHLDFSNQREGRAFTFGEPVFGEDAQVADPRDGAEAFDSFVGALTQIAAPDVRQLSGHGQVVRHTVGKSERGVEVVIGVMRVDPAGSEGFQFSVRPLLGLGVSEPETGGPMAAVERIGPKYCHSPTRPESARTHMIGKRGSSAEERGRKQKDAREARERLDGNHIKLRRKWRAAAPDVKAAFRSGGEWRGSRRRSFARAVALDEEERAGEQKRWRKHQNVEQ